MHLYRFFNPSGYESDKCVVIVAATNVEALCAYVDRYHNGCGMVQVSKDIHRSNATTREVSLQQLNDGAVMFSTMFASDIV